MSSPYSHSKEITYTAESQPIKSKQEHLANGIQMAPLGGDKLVQSTFQTSSSKLNGSVKVSPLELSNYVVEHLASFPQDSRQGQITPADAVTKLKSITTEGGLWTQLMNMKVSDDRITMANGETMEIIEDYVLEQVSVCTFLLDDPIIQHLLIFATKFSKDKVGAMHLFQCKENEAQLISTDINKRREVKTSSVSGAVVNGGFATEGEPEIVAQRPKSFTKQHSGVHQRVEQFQMVTEKQQQAPSGTITYLAGGSPTDDVNHIETAKTNRDVEILNHCIEDIESLMMELKNVNEVRRRISKKRRSSRKKKEKDMLQLQRQTPSDARVTDLFQKFKHCFNLLAKLKHHIEKPNAPELIHYLMVPLTIISKVTSIDKVRSIQNPLLSAGAIEMLGNCLDSQENDFWKSLGPNWTLPKTAPQFKEKYLPTYIPVFTDWVPPEIIADERGEAAAQSAAIMVQKMKILEEEEEVKHIREMPTSSEPTEVPTTITTTISSGKVALVVYDYWAHNNKELTIRAGQKVQVLDDTRRWWLVRNDHSEQGYVPSTVLEFPREDSSDSSSMDESISPGSSASNTAKLESLKSPYSPAFPAEVMAKFQVNENEAVLIDTPTREVVRVTRETVVVENTIVINEESQQTLVESSPLPPPPPPDPPKFQESGTPPPMPSPYSPTQIHEVVLKTTPPPVKAKPAKVESPQQDLQAELAARLQTSPTSNNEAAVTLQTVQGDVDFFIPLFKSSTADDVSRWLRKLGFNEQFIEKLNGTEAKKLFQMSKKDLIDRLGDEESASILYDELQVQIGAQTRHKTMTEFQKALVKRMNRQGTHKGSQKITPTNPPKESPEVTHVTNKDIVTTVVTNANSKMTQEEMQRLFEEQQQLIKNQQEQLTNLKQKDVVNNNNAEALTSL